MTGKYAVGIDVSKKKIDVCAMLDEKIISRNIFTNDNDGFKKLLYWKDKLKLENPHFCMEATGCYSVPLSEFLANKSCKVSVGNPLQIKRFGESKMIRQKTDKTDAHKIAMFCLQNNPPFFIQKSKESKELREVNSLMDSSTEDLGRVTNRLEKEYSNKLVRNLLKKEILFVEKKIESLKKEASRIIEESKELKSKFDNLTEIKGIGIKTAISVLSEMPDVKHFKNAKQYAAFSGLTPSHFESGTSIKGKSHISRFGSKKVRKVLYMAALSTKRNNEYFKGFVERLEKKGKPPKVIIVAIMRKLLHIFFGMLKSGKEFNRSLAFS